MNNKKINWNLILFKLSNWSGYLMLPLILLFFITGYGMTKGIISVSLATYLHNRVLPIPFVIFLILHIIGPLRIKFKKYFQDNLFANLYTIILVLIVLIGFLYLYFL